MRGETRHLVTSALRELHSCRMMQHVQTCSTRADDGQRLHRAPFACARVIIFEEAGARSREFFFRPLFACISWPGKTCLESCADWQAATAKLRNEKPMKTSIDINDWAFRFDSSWKFRYVIKFNVSCERVCRMINYNAHTYKYLFDAPIDASTESNWERGTNLVYLWSFVSSW